MNNNQNVKTQYGISIEQLNNIINQFKFFKNISKILIIGSRALGNFRNNSDIDLVLIGDDLSLDELSAINLKLDELYLPYKFDLLIFSKIKNKDLIDHINQYGKVIYNKKQDATNGTSYIS
ncbi:MAG: nucleotidyltransferase domain-containing protein [Oligoflexia bacterium]|nr:nucleotidyltransferase domain-containing protein [Oligoflexia bacterium]